MNMQQEQQEQNVRGQGNTDGNTNVGQGQTGQQQIDAVQENVANDGGDSSQTGTVPSYLDTEEALEQDNLHEDSSLESDTPGPNDQNDQELNQDEAVPG